MSSCFFFLFIWFVRWRQDICKTITLTYSDPSEVHWLSDQLVVLGNLLLRGKLNKAFADLSAQPARTTQQVTSSRNSCTKKKNVSECWATELRGIVSVCQHGFDKQESIYSTEWRLNLDTCPLKSHYHRNTDRSRREGRSDLTSIRNYYESTHVHTGEVVAHRLKDVKRAKASMSSKK